MKIFKRIITMCMIFISLISVNTINVYAVGEPDTNSNLEQFIKETTDNGYINATIRVDQITNDKYKIIFLYRENIQGMDYGFYTLPAVIETLIGLGMPYSTSVDNTYAYIISEYTSTNIQNDLTNLSVFPFIEIEGYVNEDTNELLFNGSFNDDLFKEAKEYDSFVKDILSTNTYLFEFKPLLDTGFNSNSLYKTDSGYYTWVYNSENNDSITGIAQPLKKVYLVIAAIFYIAIFGIITTAIIIAIKKYKKKKMYCNYDSYNSYNNYNDYY